MADRPLEAKPTKTCFVYNKRTGKVVHVHQFIPYDSDGTCSDSEMEETALQLAPSRYDRTHLAVLHYDSDKYDPSIQYRVDREERTLIEEPARSKVSLDPAILSELQR